MQVSDQYRHIRFNGEHLINAGPQYFLAEQLASQAEFIVNNLERTRYQLTEWIDADNGVYDCDCNEFVGFVLEALAPIHYQMIPIEKNQPRPRAFEYYVFFASLDLHASVGWIPITALKDARRGDIMAWELPDFQPGDSNGHVFFLADTPRLLESGDFAVRVYDSAASPHFDDTRGNGPRQFVDGVGSGLMNFQVDRAGIPKAFQFGPLDQVYNVSTAMGRIEALR